MGYAKAITPQKADERMLLLMSLCLQRNIAMNVLETEWWTLALPPEWWADSEEDSILVGDRDDVGCIEISTLHKEEGDFDRDSVTAIAQARSRSGASTGSPRR